jgi:two-component system, NarL family, response regulator DesR
VIRTLVAEPGTLAREGLVALLSRADDIELITALCRADEVVPAARELKPDVAVIAATFPRHDGVSVARALHDAVPGCRCAILTGAHRLRELRRTTATHIHGILAHDCPADFIIQAIRELAAGHRVVHPASPPSAIPGVTSPLTAREADVLRLAAQGATTAEIAGTLCLSTGTVRNYLSRIITKAGARNRIDVIRIAHESGWL